MDSKQQHTVDGQEVTGEDINRMGRIAARAEDRVFAELFRLRRTNAAADPSIARGILPYGDNLLADEAEPGGLVVPSRSADGSVHVYPFRAIIGSRTAVDAELPEGDPLEENRYDVASGVHCGADGLPYTVVELSPAEDPRWDLVYATLTVDADGPTKTRQVKGIDGSKTNTPMAVYLRSTVTVDVIEGTESVTPTRPAFPTDSAGVYHFPLAYVRVPSGFSGVSTVEDRGWIHSVATVLSLAPAVGGFDLRPGSIHQDLPTSNDSDLSSNQNQPVVMNLPADWVGGNQRFFMLSTDEMALGEPVLLDNSIDWRRRVGLSHVVATTGDVAWNPGASAGAHYLPTGRLQGGGYPGVPAVRMFNTFVEATEGSEEAEDEVLYLDASTGLANSGTAELSLTVDPETGWLYGTFHADIGFQRVLLWLQMTAPLSAFPS